MPLLRVTERDRVVSLSVPEPVAPGTASRQLGHALLDACTALRERIEPLAAVVIDSGGSAFCLVPPDTSADLDAAADEWRQVTAAVADTSAPTIAVIRGSAIGPAWELALACDLRIAASDVELGSPELRCGRIPQAGGTQRLARLVGAGTALRLLLLGEILTAEQAHALGLVSRHVPASDVDAALDGVLTSMRACSPTALAYAKETVRQSDQLNLASGLRLEADLAALLQTTYDRQEGISAFLERREAHFEGR